MRGKGCDECGNSGYQGRIGIYVFLLVDSKIREMILNGSSSVSVKDIAREAGMWTLREQALARGIEGITTYSEILRVTQDEELHREAAHAD